MGMAKGYILPPPPHSKFLDRTLFGLITSHVRNVIIVLAPSGGKVVDGQGVCEACQQPIR